MRKRTYVLIGIIAGWTFSASAALGRPGCVKSADVDLEPALRPSSPTLYFDIPDYRFADWNQKMQIAADLARAQKYFGTEVSKLNKKRSVHARSNSVGKKEVVTLFQNIDQSQDRIQAAQRLYSDTISRNLAYQLLGWEVMRQSSLVSSLAVLREFAAQVRENFPDNFETRFDGPAVAQALEPYFEAYVPQFSWDTAEVTEPSWTGRQPAETKNGAVRFELRYQAKTKNFSFDPVAPPTP